MGIAIVTRTVAVGIDLGGIDSKVTVVIDIENQVPVDIGITGVANTISIHIGLVGVGDFQTIVTGIGQAIHIKIGRGETGIKQGRPANIFRPVGIKKFWAEIGGLAAGLGRG